RISRLVQNCHAGDGGYGFLQYFELFWHELCDAEVQPGEVPAGPGQTRHQAPFDEVGRHGNHDGNGRGYLLGRRRGWGRVQPDDVRRELDQLGGEGRESVGAILAKAVSETDGTSLHMTQIAQALFESRATARRGLLATWIQDADQREFALRLRPGGERRKNAESEHDRE